MKKKGKKTPILGNTNNYQYVLSLVSILGLLISNSLNATHLMGGDMSYVSLGNGKYRIIAKAYRDCRDISLSPVDFGAFAGSNGSNQCGTVTLSGMVRTEIRDVSTKCSSASNPCNPSNTFGTGKGIEEHTFEATVDFNISPLNQFTSNSSCCEINFYIEQCCRSESITTGAADENYYVSCMINICNLSKTSKNYNNSPQLTNEPIGFLCCNTPWYFNNGAIDTLDFDSISYSLVHCLRGLPNTKVNYNQPYTERYFMTPFCIPPSPTNIKCIPNITTDPPRGLYFDESNGDIILTPSKCDEVPIMAIQQTEYRRDINGNWLIIGKTTRDVQIWVDNDCGFNKPPIIKGPYQLSVIEGDKVCTKIKIEDEIFSPYQTTPDTVVATWNEGIPQATFNVVDANKREKEYEFCWSTKIGDASDVSYTFTVKATDQYCSPPLVSIRSFKVKVLALNPSIELDPFKHNNTKNGLIIYPNPVDDQLQLKVINNNGEIPFHIYSITGVKVMEGKVQSQKTIDTRELEPGLYLLKAGGVRNKFIKL